MYKQEKKFALRSPSGLPASMQRARIDNRSPRGGGGTRVAPRSRSRRSIPHPVPHLRPRLCSRARLLPHPLPHPSLRLRPRLHSAPRVQQVRAQARALADACPFCVPVTKQKNTRQPASMELKLFHSASRTILALPKSMNQHRSPVALSTTFSSLTLQWTMPRM
jgi:hypothetical protein